MNMSSTNDSKPDAPRGALTLRDALKAGFMAISWLKPLLGVTGVVALGAAYCSVVDSAPPIVPLFVGATGIASLFGAWRVNAWQKDALRALSRSDEAEVIINGVQLTEAQSRAVRVAMNGFLQDQVENGLGDDDAGIRISAGYQASAREVLSYIHRG